MKPTLTKEQAAAFKLYTELTFSNQNRITCYINKHEKWENEYAPLRDLGFDNFVIALYNGYEVEKTFEDELLDLLQTDLEGYVSYDAIVDTWNAIKELMGKWQNRKDGVSTNGESQDPTNPKS